MIKKIKRTRIKYEKKENKMLKKQIKRKKQIKKIIIKTIKKIRIIFDIKTKQN